MARSLVTGGAGFIGSQLVRTLLQEGDHVRVLDNFSSGKRSHLEDVLPEIDLLEGDIRNRGNLENALQGVDFVFHQAAFVSVPRSLDEPLTCFDVNVEGTIKLLDAAQELGVRRVVLASSSAIYGESEDLPLDEDQPLTSLSPYAASKRTGEIYAELYSEVFDLEVVALRYFNVYGPRQSPESEYAAVIPQFISCLLNGKRPTIYGDGSQSRDFVYVEDVARANLLAAKAPGAPGRSYNVCSGQEVTISSLLGTLQDLVDSPLEAIYREERPGDIYRSVGNPQRGWEELGFQTQVTLSEGLQATMHWMTGR